MFWYHNMTKQYHYRRTLSKALCTTLTLCLLHQQAQVTSHFKYQKGSI